MSDSIFVDTNILVYTYSEAEPGKRQIAQQLIEHNTSHISTQVLQELANILHKKFKTPYVNILNVIQECEQNNIVHTNSESTIRNACTIAEQYKFSFYDSLIISAALECGCTTLYSEDLQHGQLINNTCRIVNPFV